MCKVAVWQLINQNSIKPLLIEEGPSEGFVY